MLTQTFRDMVKKKADPDLSLYVQNITVAFKKLDQHPREFLPLKKLNHQVKVFSNNTRNILRKDHNLGKYMLSEIVLTPDDKFYDDEAHRMRGSVLIKSTAIQIASQGKFLDEITGKGYDI